MKPFLFLSAILAVSLSFAVPVMELDLNQGNKTVPLLEIRSIRFFDNGMVIFRGFQDTVAIEDIKKITFDTTAVSVNPQLPAQVPVAANIVLQIMSHEDRVFTFMNINGLPFTLSIYDIYGKEIRAIYESREPAGSHFVFWDGRDRSGRSVSSGTYYLVAQTAEGHESRHVMFLNLED